MTAFVAMTAVGAAADLPSRKAVQAPPVIAPAFTWTGFYVGSQIGWQQQSNKYDVGNGTYDTNRGNGFVGGVHAGYNHQVGSIVVGLEGDIEFANLQTKYDTLDAGIPWGYSGKVGPQGSLRVRFGYAFDRVLVYATGGLAAANVEHTFYDNSDVNFPVTHSKTATGWTLGGGVEYALSSNWTARAEYRYTDLGTIKSDNSATAWGSIDTNRLTSHAVRIGLTYKFGS